jgi:putative membrane protein
MGLIRRLAATSLAGPLMLAATTAAQAAPLQAIPVHSPVGLSYTSDTGRALSRQDRMFLVKAHQGNLTEIEAGKPARHKGQCTKVRHVARVFVTDHSELDGPLRTVADRFGVRLPEAPGAEQREQLARLARLRGRQFDLAWLRVQVSWHRQTLQLVERELQDGQAPAVKALARKTAPVVKHHLELLYEAQESCRASGDTGTGNSRTPQSVDHG